MGYMRNHAIIISGYDDSAIGYRNYIGEAHEIALKLFNHNMVSEILSPVANSSQSFFIGPDGSKEGWKTSNENDKLRAEFIATLQKKKIDCDWVEVQYGDDRGKTRIISHSDEFYR